MSDDRENLRDRVDSLEMLLKEMLATMKGQASASAAGPTNDTPITPPDNTNNTANTENNMGNLGTQEPREKPATLAKF